MRDPCQCMNRLSVCSVQKYRCILAQKIKKHNVLAKKNMYVCLYSVQFIQCS